MQAKQILFVVVSFFVFSMAQAAAKANLTLEQLVAKDINSVLSETYNESEGSAKVTGVNCQAKQSSTHGSIAFCSIKIKVQPNTDSEYENTISCTSMGFKIAKDKKSVDRFTGWENCIESVNDVNEF